MSSSPSKDLYGLQDAWDAGSPTTTFTSRQVKLKSPFPRRQVFLIVSVLVLITLSVCFISTWILPSPRHSKPWQLKTNKQCEHSVLGKDIVVDEFGYTCQWQDSWMQPSGCCDQRSVTSSQFSCETCDPLKGCCGVYEYCVSCCLKEENLKPHFESDRMKQLAAKDKEVFQTLQDPFELCQMVCRTSSHSLDNIDGNAVFKSESQKYCYNAPSYASPAIRSALDKGDVSTTALQSTDSRRSVGVESSESSSTDSKCSETPNRVNCNARRALKVTADFFRHTTSFLSAAASQQSPALLVSYYILLFLASIAFFHS